MKRKVAFVFPGQGSQYVGMGKDFYENFLEARSVYELSSDITGMDIESLCFEPNDMINTTQYTQIAMITTELAILSVINELGIRPDISAGLSLGEYGALGVSGAVTFEDICAIVKRRGFYMQNAMPVGGAMTAIIGAKLEDVEKICSEVDGIVSIANYNTYEQLVISGEKEAVSQASKLIKEHGAKRCLPLNVSGPFHTELLAGAACKLRDDLLKINIRDISIPYVANCTSRIVSEKSEICSLLEKQIRMPVKWYQSINTICETGVDTFVEIGPGKSLSKMVSKIKPGTNIISIEKMDDLSQLDDLM